jgi:hypothetical protein
MSYKKPNRKGSRVRKPVTSIVDYKLVSNFKKLHPEYSAMTTVKFNAIIKQFNEDIVEAAIGNRDGVRLPERLGLLQIRTYPKPKKKLIDFGKSNETGELHFHGNWETDNKIGKITFRNTLDGYSYKNCRFWGLIPSRFFKTTMSSVFKAKWQKYIYTDNKRK